eukprot:gene756-936_t
MAPLSIYRSSAGSGKTYVLVKSYIQLALRSPLYFQKILAVTFTNRATQEMKQRILMALYDLTQGAQVPLAHELCILHDWSQQELKKRSKIALSHILHAYDRFSVSTIDSFLQTIVREFSKELGISYGFSITMDQNAILNQVVERVVSEANTNQQLRAWLVSFSENKLLAGQSWHFQPAIQQLGHELFKENFAERTPDLIADINTPHKLTQFLEDIATTRLNFENRLATLSNTALQKIQQHGLLPTDFAYGLRGIVGYLIGVSKKKKFMPTQRALVAATSVDVWCSKTSPHKDKIISLVQQDLQHLLQEIIQYHQSHHRTYHTALAIHHFIYAFGIMTHLLSSLRDIRAEQHISLISDAANLLRQLINESDTPFIYEKIGAFYQHFLIDEFQDISSFQWQNLQPLISNGLAAGHMSLLVGDVKQSIYRWRGSKWQLLASDFERFFTSTKNLFLTTNWRSKPHIVQFNNAFFIQASQHLVTTLQQEVIQTVENLSLQQLLLQQIQAVGNIYAHTAQQVPPQTQRATSSGYVEVNFLQEKEVEGKKIHWKTQVNQQLPALLEELQQGGFKLQDIALLVRNHTEGREISQTLLNYQQSVHAKPGYQYTALSAESLYLGQNPWLNLLISVLKYIENPQDRLAETELMYLYQACFQKLTPGKSPGLFTNHDYQHPSESLPDILLNALSTIAGLPLYQQVLKIIDLFNLRVAPAIPFLYAFQDLMWAYLQKNPPTRTHFLQWWQTEGSQKALPYVEGEDAIRILTIHQAKGLEFKVVILPFCTWNLDHPAHKSPILWCTADQVPFSTFSSLPMKYHKDLQKTIYDKDYYEEHIQVYLDHFNLLYVAFTRAEERLYVFTQPSESGQLTTVGDLIYQTVSQPINKQTAYQQPAIKTEEVMAWESCWNQDRSKLSLGTVVISWMSIALAGINGAIGLSMVVSPLKYEMGMLAGLMKRNQSTLPGVNSDKVRDLFLDNKADSCMPYFWDMLHQVS